VLIIWEIYPPNWQIQRKPAAEISHKNRTTHRPPVRITKLKFVAKITMWRLIWQQQNSSLCMPLYEALFSLQHWRSTALNKVGRSMDVLARQQCCNVTIKP